jgi:hypothetical protein
VFAPSGNVRGFSSTGSSTQTLETTMRINRSILSEGLLRKDRSTARVIMSVRITTFPSSSAPMGLI